MYLLLLFFIYCPFRFLVYFFALLFLVLIYILLICICSILYIIFNVKFYFFIIYFLKMINMPTECKLSPYIPSSLLLLPFLCCNQDDCRWCLSLCLSFDNFVPITDDVDMLLVMFLLLQTRCLPMMLLLVAFSYDDFEFFVMSLRFV